MSKSAMATSFDELTERIEDVADDLEDLSRDEISGAGANSARDPKTGRFITVKEAIQSAITSALEETVTNSNRQFQLFVPDYPNISQMSRGWYRDTYTHLVYSNNEYVEYHEFGTGLDGRRGMRYLIGPDEKNALAFTWNGKDVVFNSVYHPGVKGKHIIEKELNRSRGQMRSEIKRFLDSLEVDQ